MRILFISLFLAIFTLSSQAITGTPDIAGANTVKAGEHSTTGSGAELHNTTKKPSRAKVKYSDSIGKDDDGNEYTTTKVDVNDPATLDATNVSDLDTFNINDKGATISITGDGCTVNLNAKHYNLTVNNDGVNPITVNLSGGGTLTVNAGSSITLKG